MYSIDEIQINTILITSVDYLFHLDAFNNAVVNMLNKPKAVKRNLAGSIGCTIDITMNMALSPYH